MRIAWGSLLQVPDRSCYSAATAGWRCAAGTEAGMGAEQDEASSEWVWRQATWEWRYWVMGTKGQRVSPAGAKNRWCLLLRVHWARTHMHCEIEE